MSSYVSSLVFGAGKTFQQGEKIFLQFGEPRSCYSVREFSAKPNTILQNDVSSDSHLNTDEDVVVIEGSIIVSF